MCTVVTIQGVSALKCLKRIEINLFEIIHQFFLNLRSLEHVQDILDLGNYKLS